jgi:hypothetical protein
MMRDNADVIAAMMLSVALIPMEWEGLLQEVRELPFVDVLHYTEATVSSSTTYCR